jgi:hypothetical protein
LVAAAITPAKAFLLLRSTGFLTIQQGPMGLLFTPDLLPLPQAAAAEVRNRHAATTHSVRFWGFLSKNYFSFKKQLIYHQNHY